MNCSNCGHLPIHHVQDGLHTTCRACQLLANEGAIVYGKRWNQSMVCHNRFRFKLSRVEREQAARADKGSYPMHTICAQPDCAFEWCQHMGYLCPSGDSTFIPLLDKDLPFIHVN